MSGLDEMAPGMVPAMDDAKAPLPGASAPRIAYFVHDLDDPAVHRRIRMLRAGTEDITLIGFRRSGSSTATVEGIIPFELGRTQDARLIRRARSVLKAALLLGRGRRSMVGRTVFVARTLEMLVLASLARRRYAPQAPLVYECLDIHRLMTSPSRAGAMLRWVERRLMRLCAMLVTSSPGFVREYFTPVHHRLPPVCVLENRVLASELNGGLLNTRERAGTLSESHADAPAAPPWRIGWFGVIRCQRSLQLLATVARRLPGQVEVVIRGRPARNVIPDFDEVVAETPGLVFGGAYDRERDLANMYANVHFAWAIDYYEAGANSEWLLPNRLYEGPLHGAVPFALRRTEAGRWLDQRGCGILFGDAVEEELVKFLSKLDMPAYTQAKQALARIPYSDLVDGPEACAKFVAVLAAL